jgi:hypothetical protein
MKLMMTEGYIENKMGKDLPEVGAASGKDVYWFVLKADGQEVYGGGVPLGIHRVDFLPDEWTLYDGGWYGGPGDGVSVLARGSLSEIFDKLKTMTEDRSESLAELQGTRA